MPATQSAAIHAVSDSGRQFMRPRQRTAIHDANASIHSPSTDGICLCERSEQRLPCKAVRRSKIFRALSSDRKHPERSVRHGRATSPLCSALARITPQTPTNSRPKTLFFAAEIANRPVPDTRYSFSVKSSTQRGTPLSEICSVTAIPRSPHARREGAYHRLTLRVSGLRSQTTRRIVGMI